MKTKMKAIRLFILLGVIAFMRIEASGTPRSSTNPIDSVGVVTLDSISQALIKQIGPALNIATEFDYILDSVITTDTYHRYIGVQRLPQSEELLYTAKSPGPYYLNHIQIVGITADQYTLELHISTKDQVPFSHNGSFQLRYGHLEGELLCRVAIPAGTSSIYVRIPIPTQRPYAYIFPIVIQPGDAINSRFLADPILIVAT